MKSRLLQDAYEIAVDAGAKLRIKRLHKFRNWLAMTETEDDLLGAKSRFTDKMRFELKKSRARGKT